MRKIKADSESKEYGFGGQVNKGRNRIMNRDGSSNVVRIGDRPSIVNVYHSLIRMSWLRFIFTTLIFYFTLNLIFTAFYIFFAPDGINGRVHTSGYDAYMEVFFFSAQSLTTVGYGRLNPVGNIASLIAAIESLTGLMGFALVTGLVYGRFSRPTARIIFSRNAVIAPYNHSRFTDAPTGLMMRIANERKNQLLDVQAAILMSYNDENDDIISRKFRSLKLEIELISYLTLSWTIVHPIDENSPLYGLTEEDLEGIDAEFILSIKATDETYAQQVHTRSSYKADEVLWNTKFAPVITLAKDGRTAVDLKGIHNTLPS